MTVRVETTEATQSNARIDGDGRPSVIQRSEEHTSELQSRLHLVCRLLLEKKKIDRCYDLSVPNFTAFTEDKSYNHFIDRTTHTDSAAFESLLLTGAYSYPDDSHAQRSYHT